MRIVYGLIFAFILLLSGLSACSTQNEEAEGEIRVGVMKGAEAMLMKVAQNVAWEKYKLRVNIVECNDYNQLNEMLIKGKIDVNVFQHQPYLIAWNAAHHTHLLPVAKTFIYPMGMYSYRWNNIKEIRKNYIIAIPEDATNQARALLLIQKAKLITLRSGTDVMATVADIISNPLQLEIKTFDVNRLPEVLPEVDAAVINSNEAIPAGLLPRWGDLTPTHKDAIYLESKETLYANVFVVRPEEKEDDQLHQFIHAFQSSQVLAAAQMLFYGSAIQAW